MAFEYLERLVQAAGDQRKDIVLGSGLFWCVERLHYGSLGSGIAVCVKKVVWSTVL